MITNRIRHQRGKKGLHTQASPPIQYLRFLLLCKTRLFFLITALWFTNYSEHTPNYSEHGIFSYLEHGISVPVTDTPT